MNKTFLFLFVAVLFFSCSSDDSDASGCNLTLVDQTATGKFSGQDFTITEGSLRMISDETFFSLFIAPVVGDLCGFPENDKSILFGIGTALTEGTFTLDNTRTVSFNTLTSDGTEIDIATCGEITITEITATSITGTIVAEADANNSINGNFTATICN